MSHDFTDRSTLMAFTLIGALLLRPAWADSPKSLTPAEDADLHVTMAEKTFQNFVADPGQDFFRNVAEFSTSINSEITKPRVIANECQSNSEKN